MKISVITVVHNSERSLATALGSLYSQTYDSFEHIIIDGASTDGTLQIIENYRTPQTVVVSEPDDGLYHAMNKGVSLATGDVIGFLHADDLLANNTIFKKIDSLFAQTQADCVYGDIQYVSKTPPHRVVRNWKSGNFSPNKITHGWMPPHPSLFVKRSFFEALGGFNTRYRISADYDFILRLFSQPGLNVAYLPEVVVLMQLGGVSNTFKNLLLKSAEDYMALKHNGIGGIFSVSMKILSKVRQFF